MIEIWIIRNKNTEEVWKARSGKTSWNKPSHAKGAWANTHWDWEDYEKFDEQSEYILEEVLSALKYKAMYGRLDKYITNETDRDTSEDYSYDVGYDQGYASCLRNIGDIITSMEEED